MLKGIGSAAIGAIGSLIGGGINANNAQAQMAMQKEFAKNGIRWKVADAKAAGIHPLAALGAQTFSYNPVVVGDYGVSQALAQMGQGIDRAQHAKALAEERYLDAELKRAQIANVHAQTDAVAAQAAASKAALAKTALPPAMAKVNGDVSQGNIAKAKPKFMWVLNPDGRRELLPSEDFVSAYEDKPFGLDLLPLLEAGAKSLYGKFTDSPLDGYRWSWSAMDWIPDTKRVSERSWSKTLRGSKGFYKNLNNIGY